MTKVYVSSSYHGGMPDVYHTEECASVAVMNGCVEIPLAEAKERGLTECAHCAGRDYAEGKSYDFSYYQAAKNGEL